MLFFSNENLVLYHCETSSLEGCSFVILWTKRQIRTDWKESWLCNTTEWEARCRQGGWKNEWWQEARVEEWHYRRCTLTLIVCCCESPPVSVTTVANRMRNQCLRALTTSRCHFICADLPSPSIQSPFIHMPFSLLLFLSVSLSLSICQ